MKYQKISYDINELTPSPYGLNKILISKIKSINKNEISNVYNICCNNHTGTHIDGPNHFNNKKPPLNSFSIDNFIFEAPLVLDIPKARGECITNRDLLRHREKIANADILLIRTGYSLTRKSDIQQYIMESPGFTANAAEFLMENSFHNLRAIALDTISFASPSNMKEGILAHQIFMGDKNRNIFLIEDINLNFDFSSLIKIFVIPIFIEGFDSSQCTVFCEFS